MSNLKERTKIIESCFNDEILNILLFDNTTQKNIIWATDDYRELGLSYFFACEITLDILHNRKKQIIKPRVNKKKIECNNRAKYMAEVFTPSWVCNMQNNQIDNMWFKKDLKRFNSEYPMYWRSNYYPVNFPNKDGITWSNYVKRICLEISCGEAPYITSRYDSVTGKTIQVKNRIGLLDRKLRVISENIDDKEEWKQWAIVALQSIYGFEWQGDNLFIARKNVLSSIIEYYYEVYNEILDKDYLKKCANIISWNLWQMNGLNGKVVSRNDNKIRDYKGNLIKNKFIENNIEYSKIMDWENNKIVRYIDVIKREGENG